MSPLGWVALLHAPVPLQQKKISFLKNFLFFFVTIPYIFPRYNCREEFQIHDELLKANYTVGRISEAAPEHYLVQVGIAAPGPRPPPTLGAGSISFLPRRGNISWSGTCMASWTS